MKYWLAAAALYCTTQGAQAKEAGFECLLEPWQVIEVRSQAEGIIASISVNRGDFVRSGQTLFELQSGPERAALEAARYRATMDGQIATARNRIAYAGKKLDRQIELQKDNFTSAQSRDEAEAEKRLAESELQSAVETRKLAVIEARRAQEQLAQRVIAAPFAGVVQDRLLNPGDLAEVGSGRKPVLKLAQINPIRVDVALPAALFGHVRIGTHAVISATVGGGHFNGIVRSVDKVIDAASGTFVARIEVPNPQGLVPGGSRCTADIDGVVAPIRASP